MNYNEAAIALRDDPSFATLSRDEQESEAGLLLGSDDPLDIALAIEAALALPAPRSLPMTPGLEACRLNGSEGPDCGGREPIAGNGRCMTCGAIRQALGALAVPDAPPVPIKRPSDAPDEPEEAPRYSIRYNPDDSFVGRFKWATGATDKELAAMLGKSRATVQAYAGGRLPEKLAHADMAMMMSDIDERLVLMADLKRDLAVVIGQVH